MLQYIDKSIQYDITKLFDIDIDLVYRYIEKQKFEIKAVNLYPTVKHDMILSRILKQCFK